VLDRSGVSGGDEITASRMIKAFIRWLDRPMRLCGLCLASGAAAVLVGWWAFHDGNRVPMRWARLTAEPHSKLYDELVDPPPSPDPRYKSISCPDAPICTPPPPDWRKPHLAVYTVEASHPLPTLRDLGDRGQEGAFGFLATKGHSLSDLRDALSDADTAASGETDPFRFGRVLVATVAKGASWDPGDRMMWTRVFVQPINFTFAGYSVAATDNETVNVASVEATNSRKFSADIAATIPGMEGPKASLGPSSERSLKTTSQINAEYEKLGIDITAGFLRIIRESETGGDAIGNTTVALTTATDAESIWKQYPTDRCWPDLGTGPVVTCNSDGKFPRTHKDNPSVASADDDLVLLVKGFHLDDEGQQHGSPIDVLPQVPVPHCALRARVWMLYEGRAVKDGGAKFYDEAQQDVTLFRDAQDKEDLDIMSADEVSPAVWSLEKCENGQCEDGDENRNPLRATVKDGPLQFRKLVFADYGVAVKLAHWLRTNQNSPPSDLKYRFDYGRDSFPTPADKVPLVPFKITRDECRPQQDDRITRR
jgi:hypothetical protein